MNNSIDEFQCPFCQKDNSCQAKCDSDCWCVQVEIPAQLLALVPLSHQQKSCICQDCINLFHKDRKAFEQLIQ